VSRWRFHRFVRALRQRAHRESDPLAYLEGFQARVLDSGQPFGLFPGHEIIGRAVKIERRRAKVRGLVVSIFGLRRVKQSS
jgi:hypothetical protein